VATNIDLVFDGLDTFASVEFVRYTTVFSNAKTGAKVVPLAQNGHKILESVRFVFVCPPYTDHYSARKTSLSHTECL